MWPHTISVALGSHAIAVGTDAADIVARLEPWRISDVGEPTDYCLELHPPVSGDGRTRPLPGLYHGSTALVRSRATDRLSEALLRVLGSYDRPAGDHQVRIGLTPLARDGAAFLAPPGIIAGLSDRWLTAQGFDVFYTVSSLIDVATATVLVDPPLGSGEEPAELTFGGWWLPSRHWEGALTPGFAVAEVMTLVHGVTAANAASVLRGVASLVERINPAVAPNGGEELKEGLILAVKEAASR